VCIEVIYKTEEIIDFRSSVSHYDSKFGTAGVAWMNANMSQQ